MSCGNIKLVGYNNLNNIIIKEHGSNNADYYSLIAMVEDPIFKKIIADRGINVKTSGRQAYNALLEARAIKLRNMDDIASVAEKEERGLFSTIKARDTAITYMADIMNKLSFNFLYNGAPLNFNEIKKRTNETVINAGLKRAKKLAGNDETRNNELNSFINNPNPAIKINGLGAFLRKYGDAQDFNYGALLRSLTNTEFNEALFNNKNVAKLIKRDELYQTTDYEELGGYLDETSTEGDENSIDDGIDLMTQLWNLSIGEVKDFNKHVEEIIKYHLASLPKLTAASQLDNGSYPFDTNNELGVVTFSDANYLSKILYSSADTSNVDNFIASLKRISETIPNCECLIQLHDLLSKNKVFANKYMMVFNKPIISKIETYIQTDSNGNSYVRARVTNPNTDSRTILQNTFYNNVKNNIITNRVPSAREKFRIYDRYKNTLHANLYLYDAFKEIFPDINQASFNLAIAKIGRVAMANNLINFANVINRTVENYNKYVEALKKDKGTKMPDSFINRGDTSIIYRMADVFKDIIYIPVELNSRNPEGNLSSDVINRSFITNIAKIINDDKSTVEEQNAMVEAYAKQKFASHQYDYSNLLLEHRDSNGNIINYGLFRRVGNGTPKLTEYARSMFKTSLLNGISELDNNNNDLYRSMSDGDYLITAMGLFMSDINNSETPTANYLLPIPSDAPKNFTITAPRYSLAGLRSQLEDGTKIINREHPLFKQYYNIAIQELTNMAQAVNVMFKTNANGNPILTNGDFEFSDIYNNKPEHFYNQYHKDGKGNVFITKDGHKVLAGRVFSFKRLVSKITPNSNGAFNELIGYGKTIDILYGGSTRGLSYVNNQVVLNGEQRIALEDAVADWLNEYITNGYKELKNKYGTFIDDRINNESLAEFLVNDYLVRDSMYDMYGGDQSFYKNGQAILKRIKEVQASGNPFGNTDFTKNDLDIATDLYDITIKGNAVTVPYTVNGVTKRKKVVLQDKFRGVTIYNTFKASDKVVIDRLDDQLKKAGLDKKDRERILEPFKGGVNANDAQSYITLEEWIRRITAAGELDKYAGLIQSLTDDTPIDKIDWTKFANKVQIQKNFYYDLYYDTTVGIEVPRQVKNAEFVLIPKLIKGTELEKVYNIMTNRGIHQINTVETVKVAQHNRMTLWNNDGVLTDEALKEFDNNVFDNSELFSYNYLYRQQEVPQHMVDASNKAAIQIMKKMLDNLPNRTELNELKDKVFNNYVANIRNSFEKTCAELGIGLDDNGHIDLNSNGTIKNLNRFVFFDRFKENAQQQGVEKALLEFFDLDSAGFNNLPLFLSNINSKLESIANSYFNTNITRQLISGWHAAQLSDFGFKVDKQTQTDSKLQYKKIGEVDGTPVYYTEIKLPRWSSKLKGLNIEQVPDSLRTMIGYRIPTEGKQSICIMYVKEFLPDAYGSTVVVPDEWVTQTGSDFDVDSVYGMSKTFNLVKGIPTEITHARYTKDEVGYINYVKDNVDKASRKILGKTYNKQGNIRASLKNSEDAINAILEGYSGNLKVVEKIANDGGLKSYESYLKLPVEDTSSQAARTNAIIQSFIDILNNPAAFEENTTTSNFENVKEANETYAEIVGANKTTVAPSDFFTQLDWFDAATSGIKLKGISVNRDTFMSIGNVTKANHNEGIKVMYTTNVISEQEAVNRYGKENVETISNKHIRITHKNFGWSGDDKNVDGYLINPYSSQTTAHILDVMKEGAIHNENTYTFNAFKTIVDFGSNYDTAIGFMWQPAIDILVRKWKETNSVLAEGTKNPLTEAIREVAHSLGFGEKVNFAGRKKLIDIINESYGETFKKLFNLSVSDAFSSPDLIFSSDAYKSRLRGEMNGVQQALFDLYVLAQFNRLNSIGQDISNNLNILSADKYGAKQSFYASDKVFRDARTVIENSNIYAPSSTGGQTLLLESVFPDISGGINAFIKSDISKSSYPSLAAFLQMSTALSVKATQQVFETANPVFIDYVYRIAEWTKGGIMTEKLYNDYKDYLINKLEVGNNGSSYLNLPVTIVNGDFVHPKYIKEYGTGQSRALEVGRVSGTLVNIKTDDVIVKNIFEPTQTEIDVFARLTPAQKVDWIKRNFSQDGSVFEHIEIVANDERNNRRNVNIQYINYIQGDITNDEAHRLFDRAWNHPNPLIKLTALDLVKYAFIVEGHKFRTRNISRLISNTPLRGLSEGGIAIGDIAMKGINSYGFVDKDNVEDIIGFIRKNYNSFNCPSYTFKRLTNNKINYSLKRSGIITFNGQENLDNVGIIRNGDAINVIRINRNLYIKGTYDGTLAYYPIDRLESFETYNSIEPSIIANNNIHKPLAVLLYKGLTQQEKRDKFIDGIKDNINEAVNKGYKEVPELYSKYISDEYFQPFMNTPFENNTIYTINGKFYLNINGTTAINLSDDLQQYKAKYPNIEDNKLGLFIEINENEIDRVTSNTDRYSSVDDQTPIGRFAKNASLIISRAVRHGQPAAQNVLNALNNAEINYLDSSSLSDNSEFSLSVIANYIDVEANNILNDINRFIKIDGIDKPINDKDVIGKVLKDEQLQNRFLDVILSANTFKNKYKLISEIDIDSTNLDDKTKENIRKIQKLVNQVDSNTTVHSARKDWFERWIQLRTTNPNYLSGLMKEFDAYGDTGFMDYWIQDIRANRNFVLQNILKDVMSTVEEGRLNGIKESNDFRNYLKELKSRAAKDGKSVSLDSIIDDDGRLIQPNNPIWEEKIKKYRDAAIEAEQKFGINSVEHLIALSNKAKFIDMTTIHQLKPITVQDEDGNDVTIEYSTYIINLERSLLGLKKGDDGIPKEFAEYKRLNGRIRDILSQATDNVTTQNQDEELGRIYAQMDSLTSLYDEDGNKKIGHDLNVAERLRAYQTNIRKVKEMFYDKQAKEGFDSKLKEQLSIISKYESQRDANGNLLISMEELMKVPEYREAKEWIRKNTRYILDIKDIKDLNWAFEELKDANKGNSVLNLAIKEFQAKDEFNVVDGRKIPEERAALIKAETVRKYKYTKGNGMPYVGIIRSAEDELRIYRADFYNYLTGNKSKSEEEINVGEAINKTLEKYFDNATRTLNTADISQEDLEQLKTGFEVFNEITRGEKSTDKAKAKRVAEFIESECDVTYNWKQYELDKNRAFAKGKKYYDKWLEVFSEQVEENGTIAERPNRTIYGIIKPKDLDKWTDIDRTAAINILQKRTRETTTQYYYIKEREVLDKYGIDSIEYKQWYRDNHYFDPYTRTIKPIRIWTTMQMIKDDGSAVVGNYEPRINQMYITPKEELVNPEYSSFVNKYKVGTGYDNPNYTSLNEYQLELMNKVNELMKKYCFTNSNKRYVDMGYLPALPKSKDMTVKDYFEQALSFLGWTANVPNNTNWRNNEDLTFDKDYDIPNPRLIQLVNKDTQQLPTIPKFKEPNESDEEFSKRKAAAIKARDEIIEKNNKIHNDILNRNWEEVFNSFLIESNRYNAIKTVKNLLYTADQIITSNTAYDINYKGSISENREASAGGEIEYKQEKQTRTSEHLRSFIRRLVFEQYKDNKTPNLVKLGSLAQNIAGSKYMMMNITGGIANVLTGSSNIFMERAAGEYINLKDWEAGKSEWIKGTVSYMANMYSENSSTLQDAIIKLSHVVDFDRVTEVSTAEGLRENIRRVRGLLFSPQSVGEHYMQNVMLFAMLKSHRLVDNGRGGYDIMSKEMYHRKAEQDALMSVINTPRGVENQALLEQFNKFMDDAKADNKKRAKYNLFKANPIFDFVKTYLNEEQQREYIAKRKELIKNIDKKFAKLPDIYNQFELKDGIAQIKSDSKLTLKEYAKFIDKVREVNKKVHGVYDKLGSANIEQHWWGGMVMQYHKHLYPGFKKRYRWNGYYNETLGTIEKGSYTSLYDYLTIPFKETNVGEINNVSDVLKAFQTYGKNLLSFAVNFKLNYELLPEHEKANIRRNLGDLLYVGAAIIGAIAITGMGGDDDESIMYNLMLYHADRLASEAASFTPFGAYAEGKKLWSSPVAIGQTINDLLGTTAMAARFLIEEDFTEEYTTGRYKGMNKFEVMAVRNIPIVRSINRVLDLPNNNSYYKLDENILSIIPYKDIAKDIFE